MTNKERSKQWYYNNKERATLSARKWLNEHPERAVAIGRKAKLKLRYGVTPEQIEEMSVRQNGMCAICLNKFISRTDMHIDHDHSTNQMRDLLCRKCNLGIGYFNDNPLLANKAAEYLNRWKQ